jgi:hypothetical protein
MVKSTLRRTIAIGSLGAIGAAMAFTVGARVGSSIDHHSRSVLVARIPMPAVQPQVPEEQLLPPSEVARK